MVYMINPYPDGLCFYHALLSKQIDGIPDPYIRSLKRQYKIHANREDHRLLALEFRALVHEHTLKEVRRILGKQVLSAEDTDFLFQFNERIGATKKANTKTQVLEWVRRISQFRKLFLASENRSRRIWASPLDIESCARMLGVRILVYDRKHGVFPYGGGKTTVYLLLDCEHFQAYNNANEFKKDYRNTFNAIIKTDNAPINLTNNAPINLTNNAPINLTNNAPITNLNRTKKRKL